jgi:hypothetical protein
MVMEELKVWKWKNKKFWEELIAYLFWYDTDRIENDTSTNSYVVACAFVAAVIFLPNVA